MSTQDDTLDLQGAAALLHMHPETVASFARQQKIPAIKPGKRWVFIKADLLDYLRAKYQSRALQGD